MHLPDYPVAGEPCRASWGCAVVDFLRALRPSSGPNMLVSATDVGTSYSGSGSGPRTKPFPWGSDHPFGLISVVGAVATIAAGELQLGDGTPIAVAEASKTIALDYSYVGLTFTLSTSALSFTASSTTKPVSEGGIWRTWLYQFRLQEGLAAYLKHNITGIRIPAIYGG